LVPIAGRSTRIASYLNVAAVRAIADRVLAQARGGYAPESVRRELEAIDRSCEFSTGALRIFQDLLGRVGVATSRPVLLPLNAESFWLREQGPFTNFRSCATLPAKADVVIIGAGLTGAAAAYYLRNSGLEVVVIDQGDPAGEASGRNGGNFELIPENSVGVYEGLARERLSFMRRRYLSLPIEVLGAVSERQASLVLGLALRNRDLFKEAVLTEGISCDFSPKGWLQIAVNEQEEQGICEEVSLAAQHGQRIEIWSRGKIRAEFGFETAFLGRFIAGDGTYHPFKYVCGLLQCAVNSGVALYTRVKARRIVSGRAGDHRVVTDAGTVAAGCVIVATNAFTRELLPELSAVVPYQSQILVTEHVTDRVRGRIVTSERGPVFFNQPRDGARDGRAPLLMGGGKDRPMNNPLSRRRSPVVHADLLKIRDEFYPELAGQPPSREWVGPMAFTPDGLPCIGFLRPGVIVAAGYNGYGGSYTTAAGNAAAEMAVSGSVPEWVPEDIFSPRRLVCEDPLFLSDRNGLWRVAASLCRQLHAVNRRLADALTLHAAPAGHPVVMQVSAPPGRSRSTRDIVPETLLAFASLKQFSRQEIRRLLRMMRRWDLPRDTILFTEGSPGGTCFVLLEGAVNVSVNTHGRQQLLATLAAGSIFGEMSLIGGLPRSATCSVRTDAVLLEIEREPCQRLLESGTPTALKLLATLNEGLIAALRKADLRLMQIEQNALGSQTR
jgi:glycine/D-amino acid oxidase-like deaminating enzyme